MRYLMLLLVALIMLGCESSEYSFHVDSDGDIEAEESDIQPEIEVVDVNDMSELEVIDNNDNNDTELELHLACATPTAGEDKWGAFELDASQTKSPNGNILAYKWELVDYPDTYQPGNPCALVYISVSSERCLTDGWTDNAKPLMSSALPAGDYKVRLTVKETTPNCDGVNEDIVTVHRNPSLPLQINVKEFPYNTNTNHYKLYLIKNGAVHTSDCTDNPDECCSDNCMVNQDNTYYNVISDCPDRGCPGPKQTPNWGDPDLRSDDPMLSNLTQASLIEFHNLSEQVYGRYTVIIESLAGVLDKPKVLLFSPSFDKIYEFVNDMIPTDSYWIVCEVNIYAADHIEVVTVNKVNQN